MDNHYSTPNSIETSLEKTRCFVQQITKYDYECASTITCPDKNQVLFSDDTYVENEVFIFISVNTMRVLEFIYWQLLIL